MTVADCHSIAPPRDRRARTLSRLAHQTERQLYLALRNLVDAEDRFVGESGVPLDDAVSEAVDDARRLLDEIEADR